jgi:asparagine synthase (glutamine-hydrolysing)
MGFGVPLDHWFRNDLREMVSDLLLAGAGARRGLFDTSVVKRLVDEHVEGTATWHDQLWNLVMLEQWFQTFIDRRPAGPERSVGAATRPETCSTLA